MAGKDAELDGLTPWQKIAVLMVSLGEEGASELMRHFGEVEVEQVAQAIADLKNVPVELQDAVLREFEGVLEEGIPGFGGGDFARDLLVRAFGPEEAAEILERVGAGSGSGFEMLRSADPAQVAPFIAQEHPQTIALILSQADPAQAAAILEQLPLAMQAEVAHRIATLEHVAPEVLDEVEQTLETILKDVLQGKRKVGGSQIVADILNAAGNRLEKVVLERIDNADPEIAEEIRNQIFSFDDLALLQDEEMQLVLRQVEIKDVQVALKTANKAVRDRFASSFSERARARLFEDMDALPPLRISAVEEAQMRIVQVVRQLEEQQAIRIPRGGGHERYV